LIRAKPRDVPDLHGFEGIRGGRWMNAMNTWGKRGDTHTHRYNSSFPSLARNTNSIEIAGKDLPVEVPQRDRLIEAREI